MHLFVVCILAHFYGTRAQPQLRGRTQGLEEELKQSVTLANSSELALASIAMTQAGPEVSAQDGDGPCSYRWWWSTADQCNEQVPPGWVYNYFRGSGSCLSASSDACWGPMGTYSNVHTVDECRNHMQNGGMTGGGVCGPTCNFCLNANTHMCIWSRGSRDVYILQNTPCGGTGGSPPAPSPSPQKPLCAYMGAGLYVCEPNSPDPAPNANCHRASETLWACQP